MSESKEQKYPLDDYEEFWRWNEKIIFIPEFNNPIEEYYSIISNCGYLVFSNYDWVNCDKLNKTDFDNSHGKCQCDGECGYVGSKFNYPIIELPDNITRLVFGFYFNQPVQLNSNLTHLEFDYSFNQPVQLNSNLTHLVLGTSFNQPIQLNSNLTHLTIGWDFNHPIQLNSKLTHLTHYNYYYNYYKHIHCYKLPESLKFLELTSCDDNIINNLPDRIEELVLGVGFDSKLSNLPNQLKKLTILNYTYVGELDELGDGIEELVIYNNVQLDNLPSSLKKLIIKNKNYSKELNNLPKNLEYLELSDQYNLQIKNIPSNLKISKVRY